jgi:hypothetical protein
VSREHTTRACTPFILRQNRVVGQGRECGVENANQRDHAQNHKDAYYPELHTFSSKDNHEQDHFNVIR